MIICVNNNKGGVLKTTTVTNLAGVLATQGKKVLIVDCDNQSNVALTFGINPDSFRTSLFDVLVDGLPAEDTIIEVYKNIHLLPSNSDMISFEFDVIGNIKKFPEPFYLLKNAIEHLRKEYDYILIDTPPSLGLMNGNVFTLADKVLIPYQPETYAMRSLLEVVKTINDFKEEYNPNLEVLGVLRTLVNSVTNVHSAVIEETNRYASENNVHIFDTIIPRTVRFSDSVGFEKLPLTLLKKRDKGQLYFDLWNEIEKVLYEGVENK